MMQGQRKPWASPLGAEASTPGALLYHNRTPASPLNMLLLNGQPGQQNTPAKDVQAHSADVPSPPDPPTHSSAQQNGVIDSAHAEAAQKPCRHPKLAVVPQRSAQKAARRRASRQRLPLHSRPHSPAWELMQLQ